MSESDKDTHAPQPPDPNELSDRADDLDIRTATRVPPDDPILHAGRPVTVKVGGDFDTLARRRGGFVHGTVVVWPGHGEPGDLQVLVCIPRDHIEYVEVDL